MIRDGELLYENYLNGSARDSLNESWSLAKSVVSALIGIAIAEGRIKSVNDPITNYLPELKDQGISEITIRDLLTMGSGIRYGFGLFPWDEFVMYGFYPDLRRLMFTDLTIIEPPGQSFHYNNLQHRTLRDGPGADDRSQPQRVSPGEDLEASGHGIPGDLEP